MTAIWKRSSTTAHVTPRNLGSLSARGGGRPRGRSSVNEASSASTESERPAPADCKREVTIFGAACCGELRRPPQASQMFRRRCGAEERREPQEAPGGQLGRCPQTG